MKHRWRFLVLAVILLLLGIRVYPILAHANLARSEPEANAVLEVAPSRLRLWFTERPEPNFSAIALLNQQGQTIAGVGGIQVDTVDTNLLTVSLPPLAPGVYTVNWKALSAADGHTTVGAYAFAVGADQAAGGKLKPFITGGLGVTSTPTFPSVMIRWLGYLALALLTGGFAFVPLIYRPALSSSMPRRAKSTSAPRGKINIAFSHASGLIIVLRLSVGILLLTTLAGAWVQASSTQMDLFGLLTATRYGLIFWLRLTGIVALIGLLILRESRFWRTQWAQAFWWLGLLLTFGILLTTSLGSHAAAADAWLSVTADWVHLASVGVWVGGLVALLLTLRWLYRSELSQAVRVPQTAAVVSRFSQVATVCVALLSVSGGFRAIYEVGDPANLMDTPYGAILLGKLALIIPIIGVAALNLLVIERQMRVVVRMDEGENAIRRWVQLIRRTIALEIGCVVLIFLLTGILTSLAPARETFGAGTVIRGEVDDLRILVAVTPGVPGLNTFDIYVKDSLNRPIPEARKVALNITMKNHDMGVQEVVGEQVESGHYTLNGGYASMIGVWEVEVLVRRAGLDDSRLLLKLPMLALARPQSGLNIISPSSLLIGLELLAFGILLLWSAPRLDRARAGAGLIARGVAGVSTVLCLLALLNALNNGTSGIWALRNPIPADAASIERGQKMYQSVCSACHGVAGAGDGPVAAKLKPPPANLQIHMNDGHPDGLLYDWLTNGITGSAMPAFGNSLTEDERWDVINFIRTFATLGK